MHENMAPRILRILGSPFVGACESELPTNKDEAKHLLDYASMNKIALFYLETLRRFNFLEKLGLESDYERELIRHDEQKSTLVRVAELFNRHSVNYAVFKSIMPYPATPNDVDILHLGSEQEFHETAYIMVESGYEPIEDVSSPAEFEVHDARVCHHAGSHKKDVYDIDLYRRPAASHISYLNRKKLASYVSGTEILGVQVKTLSPEAELVAIVTHAVPIEQLCTLHVYYASLYHLSEMNSMQLIRVVKIAKDNNVTVPLKAHFSIVSKLHYCAHGFVPEQVNEILGQLGGNNKREAGKFIRSNMCMPYRYSFATVITSLVERSRDSEFLAGAIRQLLGMLNPRFAWYVLSQVMWRRARDTY